MVSTLSVRDALRTFLEQRNLDGYIAILPFFKPVPDGDILRSVRDQLRSRLRTPVQVSTGPRYLPVLGPAYKNGPANGMFIILTATPEEDLKIRGADYTFGQLQLALAETEFETLENACRLVIRLHFSQGPEKGLLQFRELVIQTLQSLRGISG